MKVEFTLTGRTPLLMGGFNGDLQAEISIWCAQKENKAKKENGERNGDERRPGWCWMGRMYDDGEHLAVPSDNILASLEQGGASVPKGTRGNYKKTLPVACGIKEPFVKLLVGGKPVPLALYTPLREEDSYPAHIQAVKKLGHLRLFPKPAIRGGSRIITVRPLFDEWKLTGVMDVEEDKVSLEVLTRAFEEAGDTAGLCDWRPGSPKRAGRFGKFAAALKKAK